jgi:hypothetical protein
MSMLYLELYPAAFDNKIQLVVSGRPIHWVSVSREPSIVEDQQMHILHRAMGEKAFTLRIYLNYNSDVTPFMLRCAREFCARGRAVVVTPLHSGIRVKSLSFPPYNAIEDIWIPDTVSDLKDLITSRL